MTEEPGATRIVLPKGFLTIKRGPGKGGVLPLYRPTILLGRQPGCDLVFDNPSVSRRHAQVRAEEDGFFIEDLGSTNGTMVNGVKIDQPIKLSSGDEIQLGEIVLIFHLSPAPPSPSSP